MEVRGNGDSWIVTLKAGVDPAVRGREIAAAAGGQIGAVFRHALNGFVFRGAVAAANALARDPAVRTVVADGHLHIAAETVPPGIRRIDASDPTQPDAHDAGFTGAGARIAILDTGVDLDHPDLLANIDTVDPGVNCMGPGLPQDDHGHGTHVAGIAAAVEGNGIGVVGAASGAKIVPIKVLDSTGNGEWSNLICGVDYLTGLVQDADPTNDVLVANMSLGDVGDVGNCHDGGIREAICTSTAAGITYVAAAGNSTVDAAGFIPAAFPEVIAVSAMVDLDGKPGGLGGCTFLGIYCDDTLAFFSNYGGVVDLTAPGARVYSTWNGGGYATEDGTSMASPHVAGVAALVRAVRPSLSAADVQDLLEATGECPNGQWADAGATSDCTGQGQWTNDPDGQAEPLVNALRAAQAAAGWDARPTVQITAPADGSTVSGAVTVTASPQDDHGIASVEFTLNGKVVATDANGADGWSMSWNSDAAAPGAYTVGATAVDTAGKRGSDSIDVRTVANTQGDWVGAYGHDGYALFAWTSGSDLVLLPHATLTVEQGTRSSLGTTTDGRALESADGSERRVGAQYDAGTVRLRLDFSSAYSGVLHLYAVDWTTSDRRQLFTVDDGSGPQVAQLSTSFHDGAWMHFPVTVPTGGQVHVTVSKVAGANVVINGLFLGEGAPAVPAAPSAPRNLATKATGTSVALTWTAPATDGGSAVSGYDVYRGTSPGTGTLLATPGNVLTFTDPTAAHGTTYWYSVRAVNSVGEGAASVERPAALVDLPGLQGDWVGNYGYEGYALFAWTASTDLVSLPPATLTTERATRSSLGIQTDVRALESPDQLQRRVGADYDATQVRLRLNFPSAYSGMLHLYALDWAGTDRRERFTVDDVNGTQVSELTTSFHDGAWLHFPISVGAGGQVHITVDLLAGPNVLINGLFLGQGGPSATVPAAPTLVSATRGDGQVALSWNAPSTDGGSPVTGYTATASPGGATCATNGATSCTVIGLTNGTAYSFTVTATNAVGTGPPSNALNATPATVPGAPTLTSATPGSGQVSLSWTAPASNGGSAITGYTATASPGGAVCATNGATNCAVTGLTNGVLYSFTVAATNAVGTGPASNTLTATPAPAATVPGAPTLVSAIRGDAQVALSWNPPSSDGGSSITAYTATASPGGTTCTTNGATSCTVTSLTNGVQYSFTVTATNGVGTGPASNALTATPARIPGAPTLTSASPSSGQVALSWTAPASNGGSAITGYTATASPGGLTCSTNGATGCTVTGLTNGVQYSFTVTATNAVGTGPPSNALSATPATVPGAPQNVSAAPNRTKGIDLAWSAPLLTGGSPITGYHIYRGTSSGSWISLTTVANVSSYRDASAKKGVRYYYVIRAINAFGEGAASAEVNAIAR
jgi:fibronectin type 3 domain-containing protein